MKKITFVILICCLCAGKYAYPENKVIVDQKKWSYIETRHFRIYHYPESKPLLPLLSDILEESFVKTTKFYEYQPEKKVPFFIYKNHNDFEQTNIVDIGEGTGGVTEAFKNRFLVYNDGSVKWLKNVIPHEFTHVMQFQILYEESQLMKAIRLARGIFLPLWMMEGMAEYNTGTTDSTQREMVVRDMVAGSNIISLKNLSSFSHLKPHQITPAYKISETAYHFIVNEYGHDKPQKMIKIVRDRLDSYAAFSEVLNLSPGLFIKKWEEWLEETYGKEIKGRKEASEYGKKMTKDNADNIPDFNTNPAVSPDGNMLAYITDETGDNMVIVSDLKGKRKKIIAKSATPQIDLIHNDRVSFSPDGKMLAFSGEKQQRDAIYLYDFEKGSIEKLKIDIPGLKSPVFSPDGSKIMFVGMKGVHNDIYELFLKSGSVRRVTEDPEDQSYPSYSPDGENIVFSQEDMVSAQRDIYVMNLESGSRKKITSMPGDEDSPSYSPDGNAIVFTSDEKPGQPINIYTVSKNGSNLRKCTNLITGAFTPSFVGGGEKIVFSVYRNFRKDIYIADFNSFEKQDVVLTKEDDNNIEVSTGTILLSSPIFPYKIKPSLDLLSPPFIIYHSEYGLFFASYFLASDLLGNHQTQAYFVYSSFNSDMQYSVSYAYKKWRPQFYISSLGTSEEWLTKMEEKIKDRKKTQSFGIEYPIDRFNRLEAAVSIKRDYEKNRTLGEVVYNFNTNRYMLAYDRNTKSGKYLYERQGSHTRLLYREAAKGLDSDIFYREYISRYEKLFPVFSESALIFGSLFLQSEGFNKRYFQVPIRGNFGGGSSRFIASTLEYRFPVFTLEKVWPLSDFFIKSVNLYGYSDASYGYNSQDELENIKINNIANSIGGGTRIYTFFAGYLLPITLDYAKNTNNSRDNWTFMLGTSLPY